MYSRMPNYIPSYTKGRSPEFEEAFVFGERLFCIGVYSGWVRRITRFESGFTLVVSVYYLIDIPPH